MTPQEVAQSATMLSDRARSLADEAQALALNTKMLAANGAATLHLDPAVLGLTVFVLACFIGYYVVWRVTPALHSPLMAVTNAISSVIIVGALIAAGPDKLDFSKMMGFIAVALASVNIFGGFIVTQRMLQMFKKKKP
jgi:H+-translocating NAD(P) transhydrogenase subunit alpha